MIDERDARIARLEELLASARGTVERERRDRMWAERSAESLLDVLSRLVVRVPIRDRRIEAAARAVIAADAEHGLAIEPEVQAALEELRAAVESLP